MRGGAEWGVGKAGTKLLDFGLAKLKPVIQFAR